MAVKRDYGSFSKAIQKLAMPLFKTQGFEYRDGFFIRPRGQWNEALFFQQSQWGSGDFCVNYGIDLPCLSAWRGLAHSPGLSIAMRLGPDISRWGEGPLDYSMQEQWWPAENKQQLQESWLDAERLLPLMRDWWDAYSDFSVVMQRYLYSSRADELSPERIDYFQQIPALNAACVCAEAGEFETAKRWLESLIKMFETPQFQDQIVMHYDEASGTLNQTNKGRKQIKLDADDKRRLQQAKALLTHLQSGAHSPPAVVDNAN